MVGLARLLYVGTMKAQMAATTEPSDHQWLTVVVVVHLALRVVTLLTWLTNQLPAAQVNVGIAPGVVSQPLFWRQRVTMPVVPHVFRVAMVAVPVRTIMWRLTFWAGFHAGMLL